MVNHEFHVEETGRVETYFLRDDEAYDGEVFSDRQVIRGLENPFGIATFFELIKHQNLSQNTSYILERFQYYLQS